MSVTQVSAPQRPAAASPNREASQSTPVTARDARALADEFAAAARKGTLPLPALAKPGGKGERPALTGRDGKPLPLGPDGLPLPPPRGGTARALAGGNPNDGHTEVRKEDSSAALLLQTGMPTGFVAPMQAPPSGAAHVDPSAFAEMLTTIWTREQGRTAKEVRVSFGDAAWPATGARFLRLEDGSMRVTVSLGYRGADIGLEALRERLTARGLNIADIAVDDEQA